MHDKSWLQGLGQAGVWGTLAKVHVGVGLLVTLYISTKARYNTGFFCREIHQKNRLVSYIAIPDPASN
jgi:hypothetical protein